MGKKKNLKSITRNIIAESKDIPDHLYRYSSLSERRLGWIQKAILESELYFPSPKKFNDPFDCKIPATFKANELKARGHWMKVGKRKDPGISQRELIKMVKKLVKDSGTVAGRKMLNDSLFQSIEKNGVLSLTEAPTNMLMWSYYGEGHSGIALRLNMSDENMAGITGEIIPLKINYSHKFPDLNFYQIADDLDDFITTEIGTKSIEWEHEEEWRLVNVSHAGNHQIPSGMIDGIILGLRISEKNESLIRKWVDEKNSNIEILKVTHKENSFDLELDR